MDARSRQTRDAPPGKTQNRSRASPPLGARRRRAHGTFPPVSILGNPGLAAIDERSGGMLRENESGLDPTEFDAEDEKPGEFRSDWPHLSELDLGVCVEPSVLRKPSREGQEE